MSKTPPRDGSRASPRRHSRLRKVTIGLLLLPLVCYGLSNLWLNSAWGRGVAEVRLHERTGMEWSLEGMSWSPWNGVTVRGAKMLQPEALRGHLDDPLLEVDQLRMRPYWSQLFRGRLRMREVVIDSPQVTVSVEMLAALAADVDQGETAPPPAKPTGKPTPAAPAQPDKQKPPQAKPRQPAPGETPDDHEPTQAAATPAKPERPPAGLPLHVLVRDARLRVVSVAKGIDLLDAHGVDLDLPVFGEDAAGMVRLGELKMPGIQRIHDLEQAVVWKRPYLEIEEQSVHIGGLKIRYIAQLAMVRGVPFLIDVVVEPQRVDHVDLLARVAVDVSAEKFAAKAKATGSLVSPMTWRASAIVMANHVHVAEKHSAHKVHFDQLSIPAVFQNGTLHWSSARAIGEDVSVLGNGWISARDGVNAVTRLVVSPEIATVLRQAMTGAHIVKSGVPWWRDLETPDRKFRDIHLTGPLMDPRVDMGNRHGKLPLWQTLAATLHFIRVEMKEEGIDLKPLPNKELLRRKQHANH